MAVSKNVGVSVGACEEVSASDTVGVGTAVNVADTLAEGVRLSSPVAECVCDWDRCWEGVNVAGGIAEAVAVIEGEVVAVREGVSAKDTLGVRAAVGVVVTFSEGLGLI